MHKYAVNAKNREPAEVSCGSHSTVVVKSLVCKGNSVICRVSSHEMLEH